MEFVVVEAIRVAWAGAEAEGRRGAQRAADGICGCCDDTRCLSRGRGRGPQRGAEGRRWVLWLLRRYALLGQGQRQRAAEGRRGAQRAADGRRGPQMGFVVVEAIRVAWAGAEAEGPQRGADGICGCCDDTRCLGRGQRQRAAGGRRGAQMEFVVVATTRVAWVLSGKHGTVRRLSAIVCVLCGQPSGSAVQPASDFDYAAPTPKPSAFVCVLCGNPPVSAVQPASDFEHGARTPKPSAVVCVLCGNPPGSAVQPASDFEHGARTPKPSAVVCVLCGNPPALLSSGQATSNTPHQPQSHLRLSACSAATLRLCCPVGKRLRTRRPNPKTICGRLRALRQPSGSAVQRASDFDHGARTPKPSAVVRVLCGNPPALLSSGQATSITPPEPQSHLRLSACSAATLRLCCPAGKRLRLRRTNPKAICGRLRALRQPSGSAVQPASDFEHGAPTQSHLRSSASSAATLRLCCPAGKRLRSRRPTPKAICGRLRALRQPLRLCCPAGKRLRSRRTTPKTICGRLRALRQPSGSAVQRASDFDHAAPPPKPSAVVCVLCGNPPALLSSGQATSITAPEPQSHLRSSACSAATLRLCCPAGKRLRTRRPNPKPSAVVCVLCGNPPALLSSGQATSITPPDPQSHLRSSACSAATLRLCCPAGKRLRSRRPNPKTICGRLRALRQPSGSAVQPASDFDHGARTPKPSAVVCVLSGNPPALLSSRQATSITAPQPQNHLRSSCVLCGNPPALLSSRQSRRHRLGSPASPRQSPFWTASAIQRILDIHCECPPFAPPTSNDSARCGRRREISASCIP